MCGLYSLSFKKNKVSDAKRAVLASVLASFNSERGNHSYGVVGLLDGEDEVLITRGLGDVSDHLGEVVEYSHMIGHTRWATHGARTIENCHPFEQGDIIGMHNGIIYNAHALNVKYDREFECDSPHIFAHMAEGRDLSDLEGYGTVLFVNKLRQDTFYLCKMRNGDAAVYGIGTRDNLAGIVMSSDEKHLIKALQVAGFKDYFEYKINEGQVYAVTNGEIFLTTQELNLSAGSVSYKWSDIKDVEDLNEYSSEAYWNNLWDRAEEGKFEEREDERKAKMSAADKQFRKRMAEERKLLTAHGFKDMDDFTDPAWNQYCKDWQAIHDPDKDEEEDENSLDYIGRYSG